MYEEKKNRCGDEKTVTSAEGFCWGGGGGGGRCLLQKENDCWGHSPRNRPSMLGKARKEGETKMEGGMLKSKTLGGRQIWGKGKRKNSDLKTKKISQRRQRNYALGESFSKKKQEKDKEMGAKNDIRKTRIGLGYGGAKKKKKGGRQGAGGSDMVGEKKENAKDRGGTRLTILSKG